ncbi:homeodomain-interacting protein kinase 2-like [Protopterus annectens]|uniref:homeodomain-interacting protein kinase 2-like n=1 Tax=Protopterus annectens TaxID=7888 RepID=UPI001CF95FAB|nr:homeodomain-interacting protein kinase 2-like [Protopterus annectens]
MTEYVTLCVLQSFKKRKVYHQGSDLDWTGCRVQSNVFHVSKKRKVGHLNSDFDVITYRTQLNDLHTSKKHKIDHLNSDLESSVPQRWKKQKVDHPGKNKARCAVIGSTVTASNGNPNSEENCLLRRGEVLCSKTSKYKVLDFLGHGGFGEVVKCNKVGTHETLAIKLLKNNSLFDKDVRNEIRILKYLRRERADKYSIVKAYEWFQYGNHACLVFELLGQDLFSFLQQKPLPLKHIRPILQQVTKALLKLHSLGLIHADIKPENILLVDPVRQPYKVKVADFGVTCRISKRAKYASYMGTPEFRAPELLIGLPFCEAVDIWALGCTAAEVLMGCPLYPGVLHYDQIRYITDTQGLPEDHLLHKGKNTDKYFKRVNNSWQLKTLKEYKKETGVKPEEHRKYFFKSLSEVVEVNMPQKLRRNDLLMEQADRSAFADLLKQMLTIDAAKRITAAGILRHSFLNMTHLLQFSRICTKC